MEKTIARFKLDADVKGSQNMEQVPRSPTNHIGQNESND